MKTIGYTGRDIKYSGAVLRQRITRIAYARNGNAHNPSVDTVWDVCLNGHRVSSERLLRTAKLVAKELLMQETARARTLTSLTKGV